MSCMKIGYKETLSIDERAELTSEAAAKLNLDARQDADNQILGHQLFFGVKLAPNPIVAGNPSPSALKCTGNWPNTFERRFSQ
jgi:hypothetical protein